MSHPGGGSGTGPGGGSGTGPGRPDEQPLDPYLFDGIGEPNEYSRPASILPTAGMMIRDSERLGAQMLAILNRGLDPASLPPAGLDFERFATLREVAGFHADAILRTLAEMAAVPLPPVGSAIKLPSRQDLEALPRASSVATTGGPGRPGSPPASGAGYTRPPLGVLGPEPCNSVTPDGPCGFRLGHPVGPAYPGYEGHLTTADVP